MFIDMETQIQEGSSRSSCVTGPQNPRLGDTSRDLASLKNEGKLDCDCGISVRTRQFREKHRLILSV